MEKKILITLIIIAASSLLWVFHFMGRDNGSNNFMQKVNLEVREETCQRDSATPAVLTLLKPGFAVHQNTHTSYVLRSEHTDTERLEKVRLTIEQPTSPQPAATECEQRRIDKLRSPEVPHFCIESLKVQPSENLPDEYEFIYQRWRGNWSDLEALMPDKVKDGNSSRPVWGSFSPDVKSPPSI